jgi:Tol biopolymer transport system component
MPDWSPDGKYLAYISDRGFNPTNNTERIVCVRTLSTGSVRDLYPKLDYIGQLNWYPDSSAIVTAGRDIKGRSGVFRIDAVTGEASLLVQSSVEGPINANSPKLSPDGKRLYYRREGHDRPSENVMIVERELATEKERVIARGAFGIFNVSPDGQSIAAIRGGISPAAAQAVVHLRVADGLERVVLRAAPGELIPVWTGLPWTPDSGAIIVRKRRPNELWLVSITGAPPRKLDVDVSGWSFGPIGIVSLSPDGRRIASTTGMSNGEVMVLENFLPARQE